MAGTGNTDKDGRGSPGKPNAFLALLLPRWGRNLGPVTSGSPPGEGVLITGVYGAGKSSVAAQITYLLEQQQRPYALLDMDYFGWGAADFSSHDARYFLMLRNLAAVAANYREAGAGTFVVAWFARDRDALRSVQEAVGVPLRVVRLTVPLAGIRQRLASDPTAGRADDLREAEAQIAGSEGVGIEDLVVTNDRPIAAVTGEIMSWLGW
jgi:adenylylsulfate kinase